METTSTYTFKTADEQEAYYRNRRVELLREIDQAHAAIRAAQDEICRAERDLEDAFFDLEITDEILSDYDATACPKYGVGGSHCTLPRGHHQDCEFVWG